MSINDWHKAGILRREIALYKRISSQEVSFSFITYGNKEDLKFQDQLGNIKILCNYFNLPKYFYELALNIIHWRSFFNCDIIKTNQTNGSKAALSASKFWNKPLIGRMGYIFSEFQMNRRGKDSSSYYNSLKIEGRLLKNAKKVVVTSNEMKKKINQIHNLNSKNDIVVIPNYVDTELFSLKNNNLKKIFDIVFVGRLEEQKNVVQFLHAANSLKIKTLIIGSGTLKTVLIKKFDSPLITWIDKVKNEQLPDYLNQAHIYILPSLYEGHPKTLIEAMSLGSAIIGANSPGIRNIIQDGVNGILCQTDSDSMIKKISYLLANPQIRLSIGSKAREYAINRYSLNKIAKIEFDLYNEILNEI